MIIWTKSAFLHLTREMVHWFPDIVLNVIYLCGIFLYWFTQNDVQSTLCLKNLIKIVNCKKLMSEPVQVITQHFQTKMHVAICSCSSFNVGTTDLALIKRTLGKGGLCACRFSLGSIPDQPPCFCFLSCHFLHCGGRHEKEEGIGGRQTWVDWRHGKEEKMNKNKAWKGGRRE